MVLGCFTEVGLPGFYFVQDRMDSRTYHSNMDVYDHLVPENLMANSVNLATLVYHAANAGRKTSPRYAIRMVVAGCARFLRCRFRFLYIFRCPLRQVLLLSFRASCSAP